MPHQHDYRCFQVGEDGRPRCTVSGLITKDWWKRPLVINYKHLTCKHGLHIYLVDGNYIRNNYDSDFVQGGNGFRYRFCPKKELWLDEAMPKAEWPFIIFHECYETEKMREGWSYERAHDAAKRAENKLRRQHRPGE